MRDQALSFAFLAELIVGNSTMIVDIIFFRFRRFEEDVQLKDEFSYESIWH